MKKTFILQLFAAFVFLFTAQAFANNYLCVSEINSRDRFKTTSQLTDPFWVRAFDGNYYYKCRMIKRVPKDDIPRSGYIGEGFQNGVCLNMAGCFCPDGHQVAWNDRCR